LIKGSSDSLAATLLAALLFGMTFGLINLLNSKSDK
jgi:hypothetical protein